MSLNAARDAILRTLSWAETISYAPTWAELIVTADVLEASSVTREECIAACIELETADRILEQFGRLGFPETLPRIVSLLRERDSLQPRKRRRARRVARWLARLPGVRLVALANTTALGIARDGGDIDFFVIARAGTIWTTRLLGGLPFRLFGLTPRGLDDRDAICLSYFIADDALDLSSHLLPGDDPYFRHWFLSLLPLFDDGVSSNFWAANTSIRQRHPFAEKWIVAPDLRMRRQWTVDTGGAATHLFECMARALQRRWFPPAIRERMNKDTTVIVTDQALKFHVTDGRVAFRGKYYEACRKREITP